MTSRVIHVSLFFIVFTAMEDASSGLHWTQLTAHADWAPRSFFSAVVVDSVSNVLITGGRSNVTSVWKSQSGANGVAADWILLAKNDSGLANRQGFPTVVSGTNIVSMGGCNAANEGANDVWSSADGGRTWQSTNPSAGWAKRCYFHALRLHTDICVLGGYQKPGYHNDVWSSANSGADWTLVAADTSDPHARWSARDAFGAVVINDSVIFVFGGHDGSSGVTQWHNDVWKSADGGETWSMMTAHAEWAARSAFASVAWRDRVLLLGGWGVNDTLFNDLWMSADGRAWTQIPVDGDVWQPRQWFAAAAVNDYIYVLGGDASPSGGPQVMNDVWMLDLSGY